MRNTSASVFSGNPRMTVSQRKKELETKTMDHPGGNAPVNRGPEGKD